MYFQTYTGKNKVNQIINVFGGGDMARGGALALGLQEVRLQQETTSALVHTCPGWWGVIHR